MPLPQVQIGGPAVNVPITTFQTTNPTYGGSGFGFNITVIGAPQNIISGSVPAPGQSVGPANGFTVTNTGQTVTVGGTAWPVLSIQVASTTTQKPGGIHLEESNAGTGALASADFSLVPAAPTGFIMSVVY